jgi:hypothetical protein
MFDHGDVSTIVFKSNFKIQFFIVFKYRALHANVSVTCDHPTVCSVYVLTRRLQRITFSMGIGLIVCSIAYFILVAVIVETNDTSQFLCMVVVTVTLRAGQLTIYVCMTTLSLVAGVCILLAMAIVPIRVYVMMTAVGVLVRRVHSLECTRCADGAIVCVHRVGNGLCVCGRHTTHHLRPSHVQADTTSTPVYHFKR